MRRSVSLALIVLVMAASAPAAEPVVWVFSNVRTVEEAGDVLGEQLVMAIDGQRVRATLKTYEGSYDPATAQLTGTLRSGRITLEGSAPGGHIVLSGVIRGSNLVATIEREKQKQQVKLRRDRQTEALIRSHEIPSP